MSNETPVDIGLLKEWAVFSQRQDGFEPGQAFL
jgi:hypothetical protein